MGIIIVEDNHNHQIAYANNLTPKRTESYLSFTCICMYIDIVCCFPTAQSGVVYLINKMSESRQLQLIHEHSSQKFSANPLFSLFSYISSQYIGLRITNQSQPSSQKYHCTGILDLAGIATS